MISPSTCCLTSPSVSSAPPHPELPVSPGKARSASTSRASAARSPQLFVSAAPAQKRAPLTAAKKTSSTSTSARASSTRRASSAGYASKTSAAKGALAFLSDPKLSVEEKLFRFMAYVAADYDKQIEEKMKSMSGASTAAKSTSSSSSSKKKSGILGSIGSALKAVSPGAGAVIDLLRSKEVQSLVKTVSGPVLAAGATAVGMPQLAPALLQAGPGVADAVIGIAKELDSGASAGSGSATGGSSAYTGTSGASGSAQNQQVEYAELQRLYEKQKEAMTLISNVLKGMHDMRMTVINNIGR